jgi:HlyD family secretion protein
MSAQAKRLLMWSIAAALVAGGLLLAFRPQPVTVDLVTVEIAPMRVTADDEGETRVHDVFVLSAPVTGRVRRIAAHVGDPVVANETVLASIEPGDPEFLDPRSEAEARAAIQVAESARELAEAEVERAEAEFEYARTEHARARSLLRDGTISERDSDAAERAYKTSRAALATAQAALQVSAFELERARTRLISPSASPARPGECECITVRAPVNGRVLRIVNASERVVRTGEALVEIGDQRDLEIVVDFLSIDAVKIEPGARALIDDWGGDRPLEGVVRRVEPSGFTKVSALGIEEQRVNVVIDLTSPYEAWERLGHGYQVEARVVLWEDDHVLSVPLTALFRDGERWALFVASGGLAELRHVGLGHTNGLVAEIRSGIEPGEQVIVHPSDRVRDGVRVAARS